MTNIYAPTDHDGTSAEELELYHLIMDYRASLGLDPIPLSNALSITAGRHVLDTRDNIWGANLNLPLPRGTADDDYLTALDGALTRIRSFTADVLVVALGLDAYVGDPLAGLAITTAGFGRIGAAVAGLGLDSVLIQEGGYPSDELGDNLVSFLSGFEAGWVR